MPIIRTVKDKDHPYVVINRGFANDDRLSWEARGVLAYLLTKPDHWEVRPEDLMTQSPNAKKDKIYRILKELELCGYIERVRTQEPNGTFIWSQNVYEVPRDHDLATPRKQRQKKPGNPFPGNQDMEPFTDNPDMAQPFPGLPFPAEPFPVNPEILVSSEVQESSDLVSNNNDNMRAVAANATRTHDQLQESPSSPLASLQGTKQPNTQTNEQDNPNSSASAPTHPVPRRPPAPQDATYKHVWEACDADGRDWLERLVRHAPERRRLLQLVEMHGLAFVAAGVQASAAQSGRAMAYLVTMCERCQANGTTPGQGRQVDAPPPKREPPPPNETPEDRGTRVWRETQEKYKNQTYHGGATRGPRTA